MFGVCLTCDFKWLRQNLDVHPWHSLAFKDAIWWKKNPDLSCHDLYMKGLYHMSSQWIVGDYISGVWTQSKLFESQQEVCLRPCMDKDQC